MVGSLWGLSEPSAALSDLANGFEMGSGSFDVCECRRRKNAVRKKAAKTIALLKDIILATVAVISRAPLGLFRQESRHSVVQHANTNVVYAIYV